MGWTELVDGTKMQIRREEREREQDISNKDGGAGKRDRLNPLSAMLFVQDTLVIWPNISDE